VTFFVAQLEGILEVKFWAHSKFGDDCSFRDVSGSKETFTESGSIDFVHFMGYLSKRSFIDNLHHNATSVISFYFFGGRVLTKLKAITRQLLTLFPPVCTSPMFSASAQSYATDFRNKRKENGKITPEKFINLCEYFSS